MPKRATSIIMSLLLAITLTMASFHAAEARRGRNAAIAGGLALGVLALGAAGAYGHPYRSHCYRGPRECRWVGGGCYMDGYGDRVCGGGHRECWRPTYCD